jgi:peptide-methionine (S)-S-oxide reductase
MLFAGGAGEAGGSGMQSDSSPGSAGNAEGASAAAGDTAYEQGVDDGPVPEGASMAVFAGGCFWCMEEAYEAVPGVYEAVSGYAGGDVPDPAYRQVVGGGTGHYEVVRVFYNEEVLSYEDLLYIFWRNVDPLDGGGQFCDRGSSYLAAIFTRTEEQARLARESKDQLVESGRFGSPIQVEVLELDVIEGDDNDGFWVAEEYHQDYYLKNPVQYRFYKSGCGRVRRLEQVWGDEAGAPSYTKDA